MHAKLTFDKEKKKDCLYYSDNIFFFSISIIQKTDVFDKRLRSSVSYRCISNMNHYKSRFFMVLF